MARISQKMWTCDMSSAQVSGRKKTLNSEYDIAFKLSGQPASAREGEMVMLFIAKCDDGSKVPGRRKKTPTR